MTNKQRLDEILDKLSNYEGDDDTPIEVMQYDAPWLISRVKILTAALEVITKCHLHKACSCMCDESARRALEGES